MDNWPRPWPPWFLRYHNSLNNFGRGPPKDQSYEIILKFDQLFGEEDFQSFLYSHIWKTGPAPGGHVF